MRMDKVDKIVEEVKDKFDQRSKRGIDKYGTTLKENLKDNYLNHAIEEQMDNLLYLSAFKNQLKELCSKFPNDFDLGSEIRKIYGNN